MTDPKKKLKDYIRLADHYKAIDNTYIHMYEDYTGKNEGFDDQDFPWEYVNDIEGGSTGRWSATTSINFVAEHPCGLTFAWGMYLEPDGFLQDGPLTPDLDRLKRVLKLLPPEHAPKLRQHLTDFLTTMETNVQELREMYYKRLDTVKALRSFVTAIVEEA